MLFISDLQLKGSLGNKPFFIPRFIIPFTEEKTAVSVTHNAIELVTEAGDQVNEDEGKASSRQQE